MQKELSSSSPNVFKTARKQIVNPKTSMGPGGQTERKLRNSHHEVGKMSNRNQSVSGISRASLRGETTGLR